MLMALALAGLSACGGDKQEYDINITVKGQKYDTLTVRDRESGDFMQIKQEKDANGALIPFPAEVTRTFPRRLEYGDPYDIYVDSVADSPKYQECKGFSGRDSAGHRAEINVVIQCTMVKPDIKGTIKTTVTGASVAGLKITNGSAVPFIAPSTSTDTLTYEYSDIEYGKTFGLIITEQPTDGKSRCVFAQPVIAENPDDDPTKTQTLSADRKTFSGTMENKDIVLDVTCTAP